jgi:hypothetical protein
MVKADKPHANDLRIEIILATTPKEGDALWQVLLQKTAPRLLIEGNLGNIVTGVFPAPFVDDKGTVFDSQVKDDFKMIRELAKLPFVSVIRLPQPALVQVDPAAAFKGDNSLALKKAGLTDLHKKGHKGKGVPVAIIDSDFRNWQEVVGQGQLPKDTLLIDLTRERNFDLVADAIPGDMNQLGHGTQCAMAAALAAPEARILLVRIDPAAPHMLKTVMGYVQGEYAMSPALSRRHDDLLAAKLKLQQLREQVAVEKKKVLAIFDDDKDLKTTYGFLGPVGAWTFLPRDWLFAREADLDKAEEAYAYKQQKLVDFVGDVKALHGTQVLSQSLVWNDGYPLGARSALTKWLEETVRPKYVLTPAGKKIVKGQKPLWFQSAGNTSGQSWQGLFRDADSNGVMEFAAPGVELPPGSWTPELNFLAWQPYQDKQTLDLPANAKFRLSVQWTEPHDPAYFFHPDEKDDYLLPLAGLHVVILRQRDPAATMLSEDDFEEVVRSFMLPQRLDNYPTSATYELYVEWTTTKPGRYAVRLERMLPARWEVDFDKKTNTPQFLHKTDLVPTGLRPKGAPTLPAIEKQWELMPRLFIQTIEGTHQGRPVFRDFATGLGSIGVPADGRDVISIGAAAFDGKAEAFSAPGPPAYMELFPSPMAMSYDRLDVEAADKKGPAFGTSLSTPFAAGTAAVIVSAGTTPADFLKYIQDERKKTMKADKTKACCE